MSIALISRRCLEGSASLICYTAAGTWAAVPKEEEELRYIGAMMDPWIFCMRTHGLQHVIETLTCSGGDDRLTGHVQ